MRLSPAALVRALLGSMLGLCVACSDSSGSGDETSTGGDSTTGEPAPLTHGYATLHFVRAEGQTTNPFADAATVEVTMVYQDCLIDFYEMNPNLLQNGLVGARVFGGEDLDGEGWLDRLCTPDLPDSASCTIESITQVLDVAHLLTVRYTLEGDLEDKSLKFGPIPKVDLTTCEPILRMTSAGASKGFDAAGERSFVVESFAPDEAIPDSTEPIVIRAAVAD